LYSLVRESRERVQPAVVGAVGDSASLFVAGADLAGRPIGEGIVRSRIQRSDSRDRLPLARPMTFVSARAHARMSTMMSRKERCVSILLATTAASGKPARDVLST
jgi:hypothetical protein